MSDLTGKAGFPHGTQVIYVYWPEWLLDRSSTRAMVATATRLLWRLRAARSRGAKVVWHVNNVYPHEVDRWGAIDFFMRAFVSTVDFVVGFTQTSLDDAVRVFPVLRSTPQFVVGIGSYRDFYAVEPMSRRAARTKLGINPEAKVMLSLGQVRRYKNQLGLIRSFREAGISEGWSLVIAGECRSEELQRAIVRESREVPGVIYRPGYLDDEEMIAFHAASDLTVLPTTMATTSGSALLALSYDRPVLVPLRSEFIEWESTLGERWVRTYTGGMRAEVLARAAGQERPGENEKCPMQPAFDWRRSRELLRESLESILAAPVGGA